MIRVRFAPSPTGYLHIGNLRVCLYNYLFARQNKGKLILRIEDTDRERYVEGAIENLIKTLKSIGLVYDDGPYLQSKRLKIYQEYAQKLINSGRAYYCFCTEDELEKMRQEQMTNKMPPMYDKRCRKLTPEEVTLRLRSLQQSSGQAEQPYVVRLKIPEEGSIMVKDLIRGEIEFDLKTIDDQVLLKSDGYPTYHLAVVVDDYLMKITHVIRGEDWLPSTPKHLLLYRAFGWQPPQFAHLPLILNPDRSKLSKRQGDVAAEDYLAQGYLPEALLNFIALLGWNPGGEQEIFSLNELIKLFSLEKIQKSGAIFNREKLDWMNGYYIRKMGVSELTEKCIPYLVRSGLIRPLISNFPSLDSPSRRGGQFLISKQVSKSKPQIAQTDELIDFKWLTKIVSLEQERLKRLDEIGERTKFFFVDKLEYEPDILIWKKMDKPAISDNLNLIKEKLASLTAPKFKAKNIQAILNKLVEKGGAGEIFWPFRVALSGQKSSPPPAEIAEILGKDKTIKRIDQSLDKIKAL